MTPKLFDLWRRQAALAGGFAAMGPFAGVVVAHRMTQIVMEGGAPSAAGLAEAQRMVAEKLSAVVEGGLAASQVMTAMAGAPDPIAAAGLMVAAGEAAMRPASRMVRANARRLSRKGL